MGAGSAALCQYGRGSPTRKSAEVHDSPALRGEQSQFLHVWKLTDNLEETNCNKYNPQPFRTTAAVNDKSGRAEYKRTDNVNTAAIRQKVD